MASAQRESTDGENETLDMSKVNYLFPTNPYHFPKFKLGWDVWVDGTMVSNELPGLDPLAQVKKVQKMTMRHDDVLLISYPKCGSHWVNEFIHCLLQGNVQYCETDKSSYRLEVVKDLDALDSLSSPRLFNTHFPLVHLPKQIAEKKVKIVHVLRNPKDACVSAYHHMKQYADEEFTFDNYLKARMTDGYTCHSNFFDYMRQFKAFEEAHPDHPILHVHYEDFHRNPVPALLDLAKFLGIPASESFCKQLNEACHFDKLKKVDMERKGDKGMLSVHLYRKGVTGDWRNCFTVAQNEIYDEFIRQHREKGGFDFTFRDV